MPAENKAEKLKVDDEGWDLVASAFVTKLSVQFGIATAGEENDKFTVAVAHKVTAGTNTYDLAGTRDIQKVPGATKDADNMIAVQPISVPWDRDGGSVTGVVKVTTTATLNGPSGKVMSDQSVDAAIDVGKAIPDDPPPPLPDPG